MDKIDYKFISKVEGGSQLSGYVPAKNSSQSGVTIATGFDLGQRSEQDLRRLSLSPILIKKLKPYLGLKKKIAQVALKQAPLRITQSEADFIDKAVKKKYTASLKTKYDSAVTNKKKISFLSLPKEAQTVIASVSFQYGVHLT